MIARKEGALLVNGAEIGPVSVLPDEPAGLREDATLPLLDVHDYAESRLAFV